MRLPTTILGAARGFAACGWRAALWFLGWLAKAWHLLAQKHRLEAAKLHLRSNLHLRSRLRSLRQHLHRHIH